MDYAYPDDKGKIVVCTFIFSLIHPLSSLPINYLLDTKGLKFGVSIKFLLQSSRSQVSF